MFRRRNVIFYLSLFGLSTAYFWYDVADLAREYVQLELGSIGRSIYEAHQNNGKWPVRIDDLEGTEYLEISRRREMLKQAHFVIVWQQDLDPKPAANHDRVLAYDNRTLLSRFGKVWSIRGDLDVEHMPRKELNELLKAAGD